MDWVVALAVGSASIALLIGIRVTRKAAHGHGWRWGRTMETDSSLGEGAYRSAPVRVEQPRRMPPICALASVTAYAWGALTVSVCAPAGGLLFYTAVFYIIGKESWFAIGVAGLAVAVVCGYLVGLRLLRSVHALAVRQASSAGSVASLARQSLLHHALVAVALGLLFSGAGADPIVHAVYAIPCAIGLGQAALLLAASATLTRLDRDDAAALHL